MTGTETQTIFNIYFQEIGKLFSYVTDSQRTVTLSKQL